MTEAPKMIRMEYQRHGATGLLCAFSDDLPGFRVYGKSLEELEQEVPAMATAIVIEQFGADCRYQWDTREEGFAPVDHSLGSLSPEMACA